MTTDTVEIEFRPTIDGQPVKEYMSELVELQAFHTPTVITAEMLDDLPFAAVEALRDAISTAGYDPSVVESAEFEAGRLRTVTIRIAPPT